MLEKPYLLPYEENQIFLAGFQQLGVHLLEDFLCQQPQTIDGYGLEWISQNQMVQRRDNDLSFSKRRLMSRSAW